MAKHYCWIKTAVFYILLNYKLISWVYCTCGCVEEGNNLLCDTCIPVVIPRGILSVFVTNNSVPIQPDNFTDPSWHSVEYVDITEETVVTTNYQNRSFSNLRSLRYLGLHLSSQQVNRSQINDGAFEGLDKLNHLDLANCRRFSFELLFKMFENENNFPNLKTLTLSNFNKYRYGHSLLNFNKSFVIF